MWLVTTQGFYSAVEHRDKPDTVIVRCRVKKDLKSLWERLDQKDRKTRSIYVDNTADYPYRLDLPKIVWARVVAELAFDIDYDNFKDEVKRKQGASRASVYMGVWSQMLKLEKGGSAGMWRRRDRAMQAARPRFQSAQRPDTEGYYGHCDTCGAACDENGCIADVNHQAAIGDDEWDDPAWARTQK